MKTYRIVVLILGVQMEKSLCALLNGEVLIKATAFLSPPPPRIQSCINGHWLLSNISTLFPQRQARKRVMVYSVPLRNLLRKSFRLLDCGKVRAKAEV